jgi:hypothetical protein
VLAQLLAIEEADAAALRLDRVLAREILKRERDRLWLSASVAATSFCVSASIGSLRSADSCRRR